MFKTCLCLLAMAISTPLFAADGTTLINQVQVVLSGGFPYQITQSGSYTLSGNLVSPSNTAINITAPNVTLDLNGLQHQLHVVQRSTGNSEQRRQDLDSERKCNRF
jgi:hypothetical protein